MIEEKKTIVYLATPYTHVRKEVEQLRFEKVTLVSGLLVRNKIVNFSPITQSHEQHLVVDLPGDWEYWKYFDEQFLYICDELWILCEPGWKESVGVTAEIEIMEHLKKPVKYIVHDDKTDSIIHITREEALEITL